MGRLRGVIPWLRSRRAGWSSRTDRAFHDTLFASQGHDAFSPAYTGNITVRRFADLTAPYVDGADRVLDIGCGLGEITCELARRFPETRFLGVDHSEAGVAGARRNGERLELDNATFEVHDMESYEPDDKVDLVTMFDSFHHLLDPEAFIQRIGRYSDNFVLIEPQGDWKGSWLRDLDLDWLAMDLEKIRTRLALATGEMGPGSEAADLTNASAGSDSQGGAPPPNHAMETGEEPLQALEEPVENRYSIEALEKLFAGYGMSVRGTISGLDEYPPDPTLDTWSRREFGEVGHRLYTLADEQLFANNLDLYAKHLVIHAEAGATTQRRTAAERPRSQQAGDTLRGPHDVAYHGYRGPREAAVGSTLQATLRIENTSFRVFTSNDEAHPDLVSYHWLDASGEPVVADGERSVLPRDVAPDEKAEVPMSIVAPAEAGDYVLAIDLVQEGKAWFSDAGSATLDIPFRVRD